MNIEDILKFLLKIFQSNSEEINFQLIFTDYEKHNNIRITDFDFSKLPFSYPLSPFIFQIAYQINRLFHHEEILFPNHQLELLNEGDYANERETRFNIIKEFINDNKWETELEKQNNFNEIIKKLGWRGILDLLSVRRTSGSKDYLPITREELVEAFSKKYEKSKNLSVGGIAWTKHCNRDVTSQWWGIPKGSEENKSKCALAKVNEIIEEAAWINIHQLPGQREIIEVRHKLGYGARWQYDPCEFIGFIEPQKEEGWKNKYQH